MRSVDLFSLAISLLQNYGIYGLFTVTFLSASLFPFPSEPVLVLALKLWPAEQIFWVVMLSSTVAAFINYLVGLKGLRWFFVKRDPEGERKAERWFDKWGWPILIASPWIPFLGDLFPVAAGTLKMGWKKFLVLIILARAIKTVSVLWFGEALFKIAGL